MVASLLSELVCNPLELLVVACVFCNSHFEILFFALLFVSIPLSSSVHSFYLLFISIFFSQHNTMRKLPRNKSRNKRKCIIIENRRNVSLDLLGIIKVMSNKVIEGIAESSHLRKIYMIETIAYTHTHIETIIEFQIAVNRRKKTCFLPYVLVLLLNFFALLFSILLYIFRANFFAAAAQSFTGTDWDYTELFPMLNRMKPIW